jgi:hypothetical protein
MRNKLEFLKEENKKLKTKIKVLEKYLEDSLGYFDSISDEEQIKFRKRIEKYTKQLEFNLICINFG